ncbi:hypothetical protein [Corynebacterium phocae]|uniref:hypothetical protein n=1 Tax=Corynebacterium phocae TaxID=161895 RepID=UPI0012ED45F8|nr:hypothetical protein [Corynebacterium phocae]
MDEPSGGFTALELAILTPEELMGEVPEFDIDAYLEEGRGLPRSPLDQSANLLDPGN